MENTITCLPCDSCLSGTKSKDVNTPLPTPTANTSLSFSFCWDGATRSRGKREISWDGATVKVFESHHVSTPFLLRHFPLSFSFCVYGNLYIYIYSCFGYGLLLDIIGRNWNWSDCFCLCKLHSSTFFGHTHHCTTTNSQAWHPQSKTHIPSHSHQFLSMRSSAKNQITNTNSRIQNHKHIQID